MKRNKKPGKYLAFYMKCSRIRKMSEAGLCHVFNAYRPEDYPEFKIISPTKKEKQQLCENGFNQTWWGSESYFPEHYKFTPLRQTLVLLMAALNNEL